MVSNNPEDAKQVLYSNNDTHHGCFEQFQKKIALADPTQTDYIICLFRQWETAQIIVKLLADQAQ